MPFTISHVAAVLPGHRYLRARGLLSAAIIGSMVPDFGFLSPWSLARSQTHGAAALLGFCLPTGLVTWWLFQALIKPAWSAVLPGRWRLRLRAEHPVARLGRWQVWLAAAAAIVLGAATHLAWDGFTHEDGRGVRMLPFLDDPFGPEFVGRTLPLYRWLQHGSSVLGLAVVIVVAWRWTLGGPSPRGATLRGELPARERHAWLLAYLLLPALIMLAGALLDLPDTHVWRRASILVTRLAYLSLSGGAVSLLLVSALIRLRLAAAGGRRLDA